MKIKTCFILMPFTKTESLSKEDLDYIYHHIIKKAIEDFKIDDKTYFDSVERFEGKIGSIISGIVNKLNDADLVIADLTGLNPNVMYELGVRHSLKRGTIIITQELSKIPSDLRDYLVVEYNYSQKTTVQSKNFEEFKNKIYETVNEILRTNKYDSPVLNYLNAKVRFRNEEEIGRLKLNTILIDTIKTECENISDLLSTIESDNKNNIDDSLMYHFFNLILGNLASALNELNIPYTSSIMYEDVTFTKSMINEVIKHFSINQYFNSLNQINAESQQIFGDSQLKAAINASIVNLFALAEDEKLELITIRDLFKDEGIVQIELIESLQDYLTSEAKRLGVDDRELQEVLNS
jgi:hypothetical protein